MKNNNRKNGLERVAFLLVHGVLPKRYHMRYRSGQEELLYYQERDSRRKRFLTGLCTLTVVSLAVFGGVAWQNSNQNQNLPGIYRILTYGDLYQYYKHCEELQEKGILKGGSDGFNAAQAAGASAAADNDWKSNAANSVRDGAGTSYAGTNLREKEVGEGDYSVTDGKYLYTAYTRTREGRDYLCVTIHELAGEQTERTQELAKEHEEKCSIENPVLYVYGDVMVVIYTARYHWNFDATTYNCPDNWEVYTNIDFYDISDRRDVKLLSQQVQNGIAAECREIDGCLYVISTDSYIVLDGIEKTERYVPMLNGNKLDLQDIYMQKESIRGVYNVISSWDLSSGGTPVDTMALIGGYSDIYMTKKNIYLSGSYYKYSGESISSDHTQIVKISCDKGELRMEASTTLRGRRKDRFSMQESGDELWVTVEIRHYGEEHSDDSRMEVGVYALDENLRELDHLDGLAKNENIYAVRYVGQIGYFVSYEEVYEEVDPLVSVDFSDPRHLKVLDELEMSGFSGYLHPVKDDLMLGLGEAEGGYLKLDLYDMSDPRKLTRMQTVELEEQSYSCSVLKDYRWALVDEENQLFGFSVWKSKGFRNEKRRYDLYHYDREDGLELAKSIEIEKKTAGSAFWKGFRVGEYLYLVEQGAENYNILVESLAGEVN